MLEGDPTQAKLQCLPCQMIDSQLDLVAYLSSPVRELSSGLFVEQLCSRDDQPYGLVKKPSDDTVNQTNPYKRSRAQMRTPDNICMEENCPNEKFTSETEFANKEQIETISRDERMGILLNSCTEKSTEHTEYTEHSYQVNQIDYNNSRQDDQSGCPLHNKMDGDVAGSLQRANVDTMAKEESELREHSNAKSSCQMLKRKRKPPEDSKKVEVLQTELSAMRAKLSRRREQNRQSARRSRQRRRAESDRLVKESRELTSLNQKLMEEIEVLRKQCKLLEVISTQHTQKRQTCLQNDMILHS